MPSKLQKRKRGRPSKYKSKYCEEILRYFDQPLYLLESRQAASRGEVVTIEVKVANSLPTFEGFAKEIGTSHVTLLTWTRKSHDFLKAYERCKEIQKIFIIEHGLKNNYNAGFAKFLALNVTDLRDKAEQTQINNSKPIEIKFIEHTTEGTKS